MLQPPAPPEQTLDKQIPMTTPSPSAPQGFSVDEAYAIRDKLSHSRDGSGPDYDGEELAADINAIITRHAATLTAEVERLRGEVGELNRRLEGNQK